MGNYVVWFSMVARPDFNMYQKLWNTHVKMKYFPKVEIKQSLPCNNYKLEYEQKGRSDKEEIKF
jgi:hypothetical protein